MEMPTVKSVAQPPVAQAALVPQDEAAANREVVRAILALNATEMFGEDNQLHFRRDPASKRMVVRVVNRKTGEVVSQIPPEYVLRLAEDLHLRQE
jgi:uncharacterized FlaG/YvyC family protein